MLRTHTCSNGVRIVAEPLPNVQSVALGLWIKTGSRHETASQNGMSHFLEHMMFKGTPTRSAKEIAAFFDRIGGEVNAYTSKEYTCFHARVLGTHAKATIDVLADMFLNSSFDEGEIEKEKKVVTEEIKMYEDTPDDLVHDVLMEASYRDHPLGRPILGTVNTVKQFSKSTLTAFQKKHYTPSNVVISIAGNYDDAVLAQLEEGFGSFTVSGNEAFEAQTPAFEGLTLERTKDTEQAHLCLGYEGVPINDKRIFPMSIVNNHLGGSMSSRLFQKIREDLGLAYSVFSYHSSFADVGLLTIYAGTGSEQLEQLRDVIDHCLTTLTNGLTEDELLMQKEQLKGHLLLSMEGTGSHMQRNGKNELLLGKHRTNEELIQLINNVTLDDCHTLIEQVFKGKKATAIVT
ncbi:M16 family metallopeptidase [Aureibacillus halotolerans]|uniref:Putative Zn-dependent peptidase n=1 Tax=Aureibacillus halotolerans TaxID=1508390 RepID=A0A4R6U9E7_9BACI|nr:pitrilysin family protein [Aureibacillus halotolerans]TDQ39694.1 putative Zn-dependent peptidase [Aureibacillus halotolerans]